MINASIIIPTYNREDELINSIKSVLGQKYPSFELIVVDQTLKHSVKTETFLKTLRDQRFRYYKVTPPSLPAARNFGTDKARGEVIIFIDDDVLLSRNFIKEHVLSYNKKNVSSVAGRVIVKDRPPSKELLNITLKESFNTGGLDYPHESLIESGQGCNMSFKKSCLKKVGGFDTNFIKNAYREETDLFFRLKKLKIKTLFNPKASLIHLLSPSGGCRSISKSAFDDYVYYRNETLFFFRNRPKKYFFHFLYKQFQTFVFDIEYDSLEKLLKRTQAFLFGVFLGKIAFFLPRKQILSKEVKSKN